MVGARQNPISWELVGKFSDELGSQSDPIALISKWAKHTITNPHIFFGDGAAGALPK